MQVSDKQQYVIGQIQELHGAIIIQIQSAAR